MSHELWRFRYSTVSLVCCESTTITNALCNTTASATKNADIESTDIYGYWMSRYCNTTLLYSAIVWHEQMPLAPVLSSSTTTTVLSPAMPSPRAPTLCNKQASTLWVAKLRDTLKSLPKPGLDFTAAATLLLWRWTILRIRRRSEETTELLFRRHNSWRRTCHLKEETEARR